MTRRAIVVVVVLVVMFTPSPAAAQEVAGAASAVAGGIGCLILPFWGCIIGSAVGWVVGDVAEDGKLDGIVAQTTAEVPVGEGGPGSSSDSPAPAEPPAVANSPAPTAPATRHAGVLLDAAHAARMDETRRIARWTAEQLRPGADADRVLTMDPRDPRFLFDTLVRQELYAIRAQQAAEASRHFDQSEAFRVMGRALSEKGPAVLDSVARAGGKGVIAAGESLAGSALRGQLPTSPPALGKAAVAGTVAAGVSLAEDVAASSDYLGPEHLEAVRREAGQRDRDVLQQAREEFDELTK